MKRPSNVLLVRHGQTPTTGVELYGRRPGVGLSDEGQRQARSAAERIAAAGRVAAVYASPLERAQQTAEPIAGAVGREVVTHDGLIELDVGDWTGRKLSALAKLAAWQTVQRYPSGFTFPNGESFAEMSKRIVATVNELAASHPGRTVVAVTHADPIRAYVAHASGAHLDMFQRFVVAPCSVSAVLVGNRPPTVLTINNTSALPHDRKSNG